MTAVEIVGVGKSYGRTVVLDGIDLRVGDESITALLGPSGSGKTTLLRLIAGFDRADRGTISVDGQVVDDGRVHVRPERRGIGFVPQDGALFPHLTAAGNVGFGLHRSDRGRVGDLLDLVGLGQIGHRYPHQMSGGQQQRVALARALAIRPRLVLLDEPFSSLDTGLRVSLRRDVARILAEAKTPAVIVTHDQDEALSLADRIAVLDSGRIVAAGSPVELYRAPANAVAARFLGEANLLDGTIDGTGDGTVGGGRARCALGSLPLLDRALADRALPVRAPNQGLVTVLVRPEQVLVALQAPDGGSVPGIVDTLDFHGHDSLARVVLGDSTRLTARLVGEHGVREGDRVHVAVDGAVIAWPSSRA